jgi:hypothetical protein
MLQPLHHSHRVNWNCLNLVLFYLRHAFGFNTFSVTRMCSDTTTRWSQAAPAMSACGTNASAVRVALKHLSFMMETPDNLRMIELRSTFKIEPDPQGGWQLILWAGDAFDYTTPFRALLGDVAEALGQDREIDLQLPPYEIGEDFVKGTLRFGSTTLRIHYEHSLSYFALLSDGQAPLAGCCRPYSEKRSSSLTSGGGGMDLRSISGNGMSPIGTFRTWRDVRPESVVRTKADFPRSFLQASVS